MEVSIFKNLISVYYSAYDNEGRTLMVQEFMNLGKDNRYNPNIIAYRTLKQSIREEENPLIVDSLKKQADRIKRSFPAATLSGLFQPTRKRENLVQHSGLICVDIDDHYDVKVNGKKVQHTQSLDHVPAILQQLPWVAYAGHSVGGVGYFALVPLGPIVAPAATIGKHDIAPPQSHEWYFECLEQEFLELGIVIDRACRDTTRLRFISYDPDPCVRNPKCDYYMGRGNFVSRNERKAQQLEAQRRYEIERAKAQTYSNNPNRDYDIITVCVSRAAALHINMLDSYKDWFEAASALAFAFGEEGRALFHTLSQQSKKYNASDTDKKYDNLLRSNNGKITLATLYHLFDVNGIRYKEIMHY